MKYGTTPVQTFKVKRDLRAAKKIDIFYVQNKSVKLVWEVDPVTVIYNAASQESTVKTRLNQKEMQRLNAGYANVELNALFADDVVFKSDLALVRITPSLNRIIMEIDDDE